VREIDCGKAYCLGGRKGATAQVAQAAEWWILLPTDRFKFCCEPLAGRVDETDCR